MAKNITNTALRTPAHSGKVDRKSTQMQSNLPIQPGTSKNGATPGGEMCHYRGTPRTPTLLGIVDRKINTEVRSNLPIQPGTGESRTTPGGKTRHCSETPQTPTLLRIADRKSNTEVRSNLPIRPGTGKDKTTPGGEKI